MPIHISYLGYAMITSADGLPETLQIKPMDKVTIGLDLQPDGLTATLAGHCQPEKKHQWKNIHGLRKK